MRSRNNLFLDVHAIQTLPPSNINRDDTGSPKTARYGGVTRARVSSQSWKKAMRDYFYKNSEKSNLGVRTLEIVNYIANKIMKIDENIGLEEAMKLSEELINKAGIKTKDQKAKALFFLGDIQATKLAKVAVEGNMDKKELQEILRENPAIDIALFGRMVADDPSLNEDASSQVAHAISTHAIQNEFDFFTAVDDLSPEDNAGAGMLGNVEFNSSTLYRYSNVAIHELREQLGDKELTINTIRLFIESFANSLPTGKVNTFANQTIPQALVVTVRCDRPISLVSAFENPVKANGGYGKESIERMADEFVKVEKFVDKPVINLYLTMNEIDKMKNIGSEKDSLSELLDDLSNNLDGLLD